MPKESFWDSMSAVEGDDPILTVAWGDGTVRINDVIFDASALERLQTTLRRATGSNRNITVTLHAETSQFTEAMERAAEVVRQVADELRAVGVPESALGDAISGALSLLSATPSTVEED